MVEYIVLFKAVSCIFEKKVYSAVIVVGCSVSPTDSGLFIYIFIYSFRGHWVFVVLCKLFLVSVSRGHPLLRCVGFSLWRLLSLPGTGSIQAHELQQLRLPGPRVQTQQLWCTGPVALWHVGSFQTRDQTCVPCSGRQSLIH